MNTEETIKDKITRQDHDTLIRVETTLNNMATDVKTLADGTASRLSAVESRLGLLEKVNDEVKPPSIFKTVTEHDQQIREFKTTIKNLNWLVSGSFMGFIALIVYLTKLFGFLK